MKNLVPKLGLFLLILIFTLGQLGGCSCATDTVSPVVQISNPVNNSDVSGIVIIQAKASDDVGVAKVEFYIDNSKVGEDSQSLYKCWWDTSKLDYGSTHTIQAKAYDNAGNVGESPIITVIIRDSQSPTVTITSPANGETVRGTVTIKANAVDRSIPKGKSKAPSGIQKVEFYVDDRLLGEALTSPYDKNWNTDSLAYGSTHTIYAKAYDNAGNEGVSPPITVTIGDSQLPTVTITSPVDGGTVIGMVTIKADAIDRSISKGKSKAPSGIQKVEFYVDGDMKWSDSAVPYEYSWNTDNLAYGSTHTIYAKAYDNAGNVGVSPSLTVTIGDSQLPTVTITSPVDGGTVIGIVTIKASAVDRSIPKGKSKAPSGIQKVEFYVDGDMKWSDSAAPYEYSWNTDSLAYGLTHTIYAKAYDNAGNEGVSPSITVTIGDDLAPNVTITSPANGETVTELVTIKADAIDRSIPKGKTKAPSGIQKVEFYVDGNKLGEDLTTPYEYSWNTDSLAYGSTHTIYAKAYDKAGKTEVSPSITVTIGDDQLPNVTITSPANGETVRGTVTIKAEAVDRSISKEKTKAPSGIQKVEFYVDGDMKWSDSAAPYEYSWNTDSLAYGSSHTIYVKAYDNAGNEGVSFPITVTKGDDLAPNVTVTIINPVDGNTVVGPVTGTVIIKANAVDMSIPKGKSKSPSGIQKVEFYVNDRLLGEALTSPYEYSWNTDSLAYGSSHTIQAKAYDNAGNVGESSIITVVIGDSQLPTVTITSPADGSKVTGTVTIKADAIDRSISKGKSKAPSGIKKVEFYVDDRLLGEALTSPYDKNWNTDSLAYGSSHTIQAKAYDNAGNVGESSIITVVIGDSQLPTVTITSPADGSKVTGTVTIKADAIDRSISKGKSKAPSGIQKVEFYIDGDMKWSDSAAPYEYSWNTDTLAYGSSHTIYAKAYDNTGKTEVSPSITVTIGDDLAPNVTITSPANGETVTELVTIKADAIDRSISKGKMKAPSGVQKVEFYIDEQLKYTDYNSPYSYNWNTDSLQYGSTHIVTVIAYDFSGNTGRDSVAVIIGNGEAPMVTITSPVNGSKVTGTVIIKADAIDRSISKEKTKAPSGIQKVEFYVNDIKLGEDLTAPYEYSWNTDSLAYGSSHTIYAKAYDNAGKEGVSFPITVTKGDDLAPNVTVTIINPVDGNTVVGPVTGTVIIRANAVDRSIPKGKSKVPSGIKRVEFYVDDRLLGEALTSPYEYSWNTDSFAYGSTHTIYAKAYDDAGNEGESSIITVVIGDSQLPTVTITNPVDGGTVIGIVTIKANAVDRSISKGKSKAPSGIKKVEFYVDDRLLGEALTSPYEYSWNTDTLAYGSSHTVYAKAYDNTGKAEVSPSITVTIGDNLAPTVTITNPADGSKVTGMVTIKANAVDRSISKGKSKAPSGIQKVEFYIDGDMKWSDSAAPYEYSWNTDSFAYGSTHTIYAKAYDNTGKAEVSPSITVTIGDNLAPNVTITSPANGETVTELVTVIVTAEEKASSKKKAISGIKKVELYINGDKVGESPSVPYEYKWDTVTCENGKYTLIARVCDMAENEGESTPVSVTVNNPETYRFLAGWGSLGSVDGRFNKPRGIAVDLSGHVYVADYNNHRIQKFDSNGNFITKWGFYGSANGQFQYPFGIAVDSSGYVYVADTKNHRIQKFDSNGNFITKWGSYGSGNGDFNSPCAIAVDSYGNIYVADTYNNRIQKFDSNGTFITKWGSYGTGNGAFDHPFGIAVDTLGNVYVTDTENNRIQKFDSNGIFITKWGSYGSDEGQFMFPYGIAVDTLGNVYVTDTENNRIQEFTPNGTFVTKWGLWGSESSHFKWPYGIAIKSIEDYVYVSDTENDRIQKFECIRRIRRK